MFDQQPSPLVLFQENAGSDLNAVPNSETNITKNFDEATNSMDMSELDASVSSSATDLAMVYVLFLFLL